MWKRYLKVQTYFLFCGAIGPLFLVMYFASGRDAFLYWFLWSGLLVTAGTVVAAVWITLSPRRSAAKLAALEQTGVLASAHIMRVHETGTHINDQPLVRLDLQFSGPGIPSFASQDKVIASIERMPIITSRRLVALVDPATNDYEIDWERSALVSGVIPAKFTFTDDDQTYDLTGRAEPLMAVLRILKDNGIKLDNVGELRSNPAARQQVQAIVRQAAAPQTPSAPPEAASTTVAAPPQPSMAQRLQELETLRATGVLSEDEYTTKREQIIATSA